MKITSPFIFLCLTHHTHLYFFLPTPHLLHFFIDDKPDVSNTTLSTTSNDSSVSIISLPSSYPTASSLNLSLSLDVSSSFTHPTPPNLSTSNEVSSSHNIPTPHSSPRRSTRPTKIPPHLQGYTFSCLILIC